MLLNGSESGGGHLPPLGNVNIASTGTELLSADWPEGSFRFDFKPEPNPVIKSNLGYSFSVLALFAACETLTLMHARLTLL